MFLKLVMLFTIIPLLDFALLLKVGDYIGFLNTILLVIATGSIGAFFTKREGKDILNKIKFDISQGKMPADEILGGLCVIIGGVCLISPGLVTDALGFTLVLPITRVPFVNIIRRKLKEMLLGGNFKFYFRK